MAKLRIYRGGGFTVTLADGTTIEANWSRATTPAEVAAECRKAAAWRRQEADALRASAARYDRVADELDPPALPLEDAAP